jgi:hypothetical protein
MNSKIKSEKNLVFKAVQSFEATTAPSIILADDDQMNLLVISRMLESMPSVRSNHVKVIQVING